MTGTSVRQPRVRHRARAFTLVELLVVIGLLAILLALIAPRLRSDARDAEVFAGQAASLINAAAAHARARETRTCVTLSGGALESSDVSASVLERLPVPGTLSATLGATCFTPVGTAESASTLNVTVTGSAAVIASVTVAAGYGQATTSGGTP